MNQAQQFKGAPNMYHPEQLQFLRHIRWDQDELPRGHGHVVQMMDIPGTLL